MPDRAQSRMVILMAAARLFASAGYAAVSMRDVAAETSMTPANLYYHFKDKETLIRETLVYVFADRTSSLDIVFLQADTQDEKIDVFIDWVVHLLFEDAVFSKLLLRELLDGSARRLEYITKTVFEHPFSLISNAATDRSNGLNPPLMAASLAGPRPRPFPDGGNAATPPWGTFRARRPPCD
jgi:AcrR family transcriptional regulator